MTAKEIRAGLDIDMLVMYHVAGVCAPVLLFEDLLVYDLEIECFE